MAKSRLGTYANLPPWPRNLSPAAAPGFQSGAVALTGLNHAFSMLAHVWWSDGVSHALRYIHWRSSSASSPSLTLRAGPRDPDTAASAPPGHGDATVDEFGTHVDPAANTSHTTTLDADRTTAHLELLAFMWDVSAFASGNVQLSTLSAIGTSQAGRPVAAVYNGSTWGPPGVNCIFHATLEAADGTFGYLLGTLPRLSAINTEAFNSGTLSGAGGDERGVSLTVAAPRWLGPVGFLMQAAADADFSCEVYEDGVLMANGSQSMHSSLWHADASVRWFDTVFPDLAFTPGHAYDVMIKPATGNNVTLYSMDVTAAGHLLPFADTLHYSQRTDGGSITRTTTRIPVATLGLSAVDDGAGAGGAGGIRTLLNAGLN